MHPDPTKEASSVLNSRESRVNKPKARAGRAALTERYLNINKQQDGGPEFPPQALPHPVPLFCPLNATSQDLLQPISPPLPSGLPLLRSYMALLSSKPSAPGWWHTLSSEYPCLEIWDLNRNHLKVVLQLSTGLAQLCTLP